MKRPSTHKGTVRAEAYRPEFAVENDFDYTSPYPCGVCGETFRSRHQLATHPHDKRKG